jgi:metallo-beta-lactamase class B
VASLTAVVFALLGAGPRLRAQTDAYVAPARPDNTNVKRDPAKLIGNIYWVGHSEVGSFLITTPQGHILMDTTSAEEWPWVRENIEKLGYKMSDVKILINSHPHAEHIGGMAMVKQLTGAKLITSVETAADMSSGGRNDFREDGSEQYTPVKPDQTVPDGGKVEFGGVTLTAHITPGHTKGCTTWTTTVDDGGQKRDVVFVCGVANHGIERATILNNERYPNMRQDFEKAFRVLRSLNCEVFLYVRATTIHLDEKLAKLKSGATTNPFIDPQGCKGYIDEYEARYLDQLKYELAHPKQ